MKRKCFKQLLFCIFVFYFVSFSLGTNIGFSIVGNAVYEEVDKNDVWIQEFYKDVFGDPTDELYFVNRTPFAGTFNSAEYDDAPLSVNVVIDENDLYFVLYENESVKLKNRSENTISYNIAVKAADGSKFSALGSMQSGSDRIVVEKLKKDRIINSLLEGANGGQVIIYIENEIQQFSNYLFTVDCANLDDLFYGDQYREALNLIENGNQLDGLEVLIELGDYKDSNARSESIIQQYGGYSGIGNLYSDGDGVEQSYEKAVEWYLRGAQYEDIDSMMFLGFYYEEGTGVDQDYEKAFEYFHRVSECTDDEVAQYFACNKIAYYYDYGLGVEQDYKKAMEWYLKAAEFGNPNAMSSIGAHYQFGLKTQNS